MAAQRNLGDLPDSVLDEILGRLPIKDAARTSILSRFWCHRWHSIPDLVLIHVDPSVITDQVLRLHSGSVRRFYACARRGSFGSVIISGAEDWLATLSLHSGFTLVSLDLYADDCFDIDSIARRFPNLTRLGLTFCQTFHPQFRGFSFLKILRIRMGSLTNVGDLSKLVSSCPLLEDLNFCIFGNTPSSRDHAAALEIVSPNLRYLYLYGLKFCQFAVTSAPLLETAEISDCYFDGDEGGGSDDIRGYDLLTFFVGMASVKKLQLPCQLLGILGRDHGLLELPMTFNDLSFFRFDISFHDEKAVLVALCLLRSSPSIRNLEINEKWTTESDKEHEALHDFWEEQEAIHLFNTLEHVELRYIECSKNAVAFIKLLLANSQSLKTMIINRHYGNFPEHIIAELLEYPRASIKAQILVNQWI